ncbi:MAG: transglycosylase domain-containing protein [Erysipelotrichaceae bacterium]|nr:transglycosylase domain-containing protein [Erysipelotrichaceae bacterium]
MKNIERKQMIRIVEIIAMVIMIIIASVSIYFGYGVIQQVEGFSKDKLLNSESSVQVDQDGNEYYYYGSEGVKKNVEYDDIPQVMIDAVLAAEDSRYFEHNGFDVPRIIKALMGNIVAGGITAGGSTITQQTIKKSYYPDAEQTITRKIGEVILSIEATSQTTKEEILELYLNKVYFGSGINAIGIYAACQYYFGKAVENLTLPEAALLAGAINNPNKYDPFNNLEAAQTRRDTVLDLMEYHGYISEQECEDAKSIPVENTLNYNSLSANSEYQAYADKVTREVYEKTGYDPSSTPMIITTYIDTGLQSYLDEIADGDVFSFPDEYLQTGASVQESTTGRIVGVLAARDYVAMGTSYAYAASKELVATNPSYNYGQRNSPGSSLKPIVAYASAFEYLDYATCHYVHDVPYSQGSWTPKNWDNQYHGDVSITEALVQSWNLAAIQTLNEVISEVGTSEMISYMEGFGFDMYEEDFNLGYAIGSWNTGVSPEEEAAAYAAIANGGTYIEPHTVEKIELLDTGEVIYIDEEAQENSVQALSAESAFMIRSVMTSYVKTGSGNYSYLNLGYEIGAKTGTSNHDSSTSNQNLVGKSKDLWMAAFSADYSWSVWCGYNSEAQKLGYYPTGKPAAQISALIAKYLHSDGVTNSYPSQPSGVVEATCVSGIYPYVKAGDGVPSNRIVSGYFKSNNTPSGSASGASITSLSEFTAEIVNDNQVKVTFSELSESYTSGTPTKTYTVNGKSYTLPYYGDINQLYGNVVYVAEITDSSGEVVHSETLSSNTATLNYTLSPGKYTVSGYYAYESNTSTTSNKISQEVTVESTTPATYTASTPTTTSISYTITVPTGSSVTVELNGASKTISENSTVTFSGLTPSTKYTTTFSETTITGTTRKLDSHTFTTADEPTTSNDDSNSHNNENSNNSNSNSNNSSSNKRSNNTSNETTPQDE